MPLYLLHGDTKSVDSYKVRARMEELLKGIPREGNINFTSFDLSSQGVTFHDVVESAMTVPFLGGSRTVVARNVKAVERAFNIRGEKSEDEKDAPDPEAGEPLSESAELILRAVARLTSLPEDSLLILVEENGHLDGRTRFYQALKDAGCRIETFKAMWFDPASGETDTVVSFVQEQAARLGIRLSRDLAEQVALLVGSDSGAIVRELEKLVLFLGRGRKATLEDIRAVITPTYEAGIFQLVDLIGYGRTAEALKVLSDLLDSGAKEPYVLSMIARQMRLIARVRELKEAGFGGDFAKALKESPFVIKKVLEQARRFPRFEYSEIVERLMETDIHIKRGTMPGKLALEILITRLGLQNE